MAWKITTQTIVSLTLNSGLNAAVHIIFLSLKLKGIQPSVSSPSQSLNTFYFNDNKANKCMVVWTLRKPQVYAIFGNLKVLHYSRLSFNIIVQQVPAGTTMTTEPIPPFIAYPIAEKHFPTSKDFSSKVWSITRTIFISLMFPSNIKLWFENLLWQKSLDFSFSYQ